jgi:hypothetical protein
MQRVSLVFLISASLAAGFISCSDSPTQPNVTPTPVPTATPTPIPNAGPTPPPRPIPPPAPANQNPVAKVSIQIETVTCDGEPQKTNTSWDIVKVGCKMYFDTTPKDAGNNRTTPEGIPEWTFDPGNLVSVNLNDPFTPIVTADNDGVLIVYSVVDGVRSRDLEVKLID